MCVSFGSRLPDGILVTRNARSAALTSEPQDDLDVGRPEPPWRVVARARTLSTTAIRLMLRGSFRNGRCGP